MSPESTTHVVMTVTDEQRAELRRLLSSERGTLTILPVVEPDPAALRDALAFYADPENWREGAGTGPQRAAPCVADCGAQAREVLARLDTGTGYAGPPLSKGGETGAEWDVGSGTGPDRAQRADLEGSR